MARVPAHIGTFSEGSMLKGWGTGALVTVEQRVGAEVEAALRKRTSFEPKLAAVLRALAPSSAPLRNVCCGVVKEAVKAESFERELYSASLRALADSGEKKLAPLLASALKSDDFGGLPALSTACFIQDASLGPALARGAASSKTQIAFAAEVARLFRGEPTGARLFSLAARIKEAHRIALSVELLLPLCLRKEELAAKPCAGLGDAMLVLRGSERHLGRWLLMAELAHRGADPRPLKEATERTSTGPDSSRAAWCLVVWALEPGRGTGGTRPTSELVARLSHRPSADRDTAFLFRMADAKLDVARPMLEALARTRPLGDDVALRASFLLAKHYDREAFVRDVHDAAESPREDIRGLAAAALWDLGERERASELARSLVESPDLTAATWSALVAWASLAAGKRADSVLTETAFRRVQLGWME